MSNSPSPFEFALNDRFSITGRPIKIFILIFVSIWNQLTNRNYDVGQTVAAFVLVCWEDVSPSLRFQGGRFFSHRRGTALYIYRKLVFCETVLTFVLVRRKQIQLATVMAWLVLKMTRGWAEAASTDLAWEHVSTRIIGHFVVCFKHVGHGGRVECHQPRLGTGVENGQKSRDDIFILYWFN